MLQLAGLTTKRCAVGVRRCLLQKVRVVIFQITAQNVRSKLRILHFASCIQIYLGEGGRDKKPAFLRQTLSNGLCRADLFVHIPRAKKLHTAFLIFESAESACLPYQNSIFIIL